MPRDYASQTHKKAKSRNQRSSKRGYSSSKAAKRPNRLRMVMAAGAALAIAACLLWITSQKQQNKAKPPVAKSVTQKAPAPVAQPKFDFYTLLPKKDSHANGTASAPLQAPQVPAKTKPANPATADTVKAPVSDLTSDAHEQDTTNLDAHAQDPSRFRVQVASFRSLDDANHLKAELILEGFDVLITKVNKDAQDWHRVNIGPFSSLQAAQQAQASLHAQQHAGIIMNQNHNG